MHVIHPQGMYNGLPPEDVFIVMDDMGNQLGLGYIVYTIQAHIYPDCPVNLYFSMECQPTGRYMLFGALMARARQLRDFNPDMPARVYTNIAPGDTMMKDFYQHNGFSLADAEHQLVLYRPERASRAPMGSSFRQPSLNTQQEQDMLVERMRQNDLTYITRDALAEMMRMPHFMAIGLCQNDSVVGEILLSGQGDACEISAIYVAPEHRGRGMGTALVHRAMDVMAAAGVTHITTRVMSRSIPQCRLMEKFNATVQGIYTIYPSMPLQREDDRA